MIEIDIFTNNKGFKRLTAKGHALFDKSGKDIVCAAVSVLLQSWLNALLAVLKFEPENHIRFAKGNGILELEVIQNRLDENQLNSSNLIWQVFHVNLAQLAKDNPDYIKLTDKNQK